MKIIQHLPNTLTCGNLLCGCVGIVAVFQNDLVLASYLIGVAAVLDFLDGFLARLLNAFSPIGKELDSLADCVTFGVLPSVILFSLFQQSFPGTVLAQQPIPPLCYLAFLIAIFSALRLAKFNVDTRQTNSFIGVPTPANAILIGSLPLIMKSIFFASIVILDQRFLIGLTLLMSYLLVAEIELFALKFKNYAWAGNQIKYVFLILSVVLLASLQFVAIPLIIFLYVLLSVLNNRFSLQKIKD
ncbi:MAG: CDP-diacylglycerol--serine O-phosphatidyltransferase [Bacteroidota bacterium]